jgi:pyridoxine 5-phosphate synthase
MTGNNKLLLGVNIDHVATLRQSRLTDYPDPVEVAYIAEKSGADYITLHLREDRRHIQERDVEKLNSTVRTHLNLEMAVTDEMLDYATTILPQECCLVPERREELTTEGGLDVRGNLSRVREACHRLSESGIRVSLFIDADAEQVGAALEAGAPVVEIHTGHFADAVDNKVRDREYNRIVDAVRQAHDKGLYVNAGHGLNYDNVIDIAKIREIRELNIGHAIIARAIYSGITDAVHEMKRLMIKARTNW